MQANAVTIADLVREGASQFAVARLCIAHHEDNAIDEARSLVLHALHLPAQLPALFANARLCNDEVAAVRALFARRVNERVPAAYLIGWATFAGLQFKTDARALVPRSPFAEMIEQNFSPWLDEVDVHSALDLCCGGGTIGMAMAKRNPRWQVDLCDLSAQALGLAQDNLDLHQLRDRVDIIQSDLFASLIGKRYDLIVSNPPYITDADYADLPAEYRHEPKLALPSGADGLDITLRILCDAADHLTVGGVLMVEIGEARHALKKRLPALAFNWPNLSVGAMGIFVITARELRTHYYDIRHALLERNATVARQA
jgi:ribosomal protein L3 glutamine methyltransferase